MSRSRAIEAADAFWTNGQFLSDLARRVAIRTESQDPERLSDCADYLALLADDFQSRLGFACAILPNPDQNAGPFLVAERHEAQDRPTLLVYGHGDVVPGMADQWSEGRNPWTVSHHGDRIYGRGTADNKGQHTIAMLALEAILRTRGHLGFNTKFLIETSEETGSPGLAQFCELYRDRLAADLLIASDGPRLIPSEPTLVGGTRGTLSFDLVCDLREGAHHSGNWGGLIANPGVLLAHAIASLVSPTGRIKARSLLPQAIPENVRHALRDAVVNPGPDGPALDLWWGEPGLSQAERVFGWTALEVLAFEAGHPDNPVNAIPPRAWARCQIRYTVDTNPASFLSDIRSHLDRHDLNRVAVHPVDEALGQATRLDPDHPVARWASDSVTITTGHRPLFLPNGGGSLPNDCFADILGMPTIWVPHSYSGCQQHAPDEHLLAPLVREGLAIMAGLFWDLGQSTGLLQKGEST